MKNIKVIFIFLICTSLISFAAVNADDKKSKKPKKKNIQISLLSISLKVNGLKGDEEFNIKAQNAALVQIAFRWQPIITAVRDGILPKHDAIDSILNFTNSIWDFLDAKVKANKLKKYSVDEWVFPVKGYNSEAIGGNRGSGYVTAGFDFFDKNSGGHPAHDIFINDSDQDCLDDITNSPVEILSMSGGIVIETRKNWTTNMMDIKGGNIVYIYDNYTNGFFYYAHMNEVNVNVGDLVEPGTSLGTLGRTGKNAYPSRSPTHLHIMYVRTFEGDLRPENIYNDLISVKTIE
ncbi:MAG: M23 family metallopeptidase [Bacteroidota bacterium]|nr:M23 family metallopeptidase [Bacteroidota bacterium]